MSEFKVEVVRLGPIIKHLNADRLGITQVHGGYPVITNISGPDAFKEGDLAVYVPVDSLVPALRPEFAFLVPEPVRKDDMTDIEWAERRRRYEKEKSELVRIKARKLRGIFSMGLLVPPPLGAHEGDNVQLAYGIEKYEPDIANRKGGSSSPAGESEPDQPFMPVYTDIEGLRKWGKVFTEGEEVIITEKIHGCLPAYGKVVMADGELRKISQVKIGDEVLGVDVEGRVTSTIVTQVFNNGVAERWLSVKGERRAAGRGSHFFAMTLTPEHLVWSVTRQAYVEAGALLVNEEVALARGEYDLTPLQAQVLLGKLLGDGSLQMRQWSAAVYYGHKSSQREYLDWTRRALGDLAKATEITRTSGYGAEMAVTWTVFNAKIRDRFGSMVESGKKRVPEWVADAMTPLTIAFWYMDDGSLAHDEDQEDRAMFAVCAFDQTSVAILQRGLQRYGIDSVFYTSLNKTSDAEHPRLRINSDDAERLFLLIAPYVPPCMQYKLPERYRGGPGWLPPDTTRQYKPMLVPQKVTSITDVTTEVSSARYDIETETHNFFTHGVLVHNSNARYIFHDGRLWVGSHFKVKRRPHKVTQDEHMAFECAARIWTVKHQVWLLAQWVKWLLAMVGIDLRLPQEPPRPRKPHDVPTTNWWDVAIRNDFEARLSFEPDLLIFGEVYGPCQDLKYGSPSELKFRAFDAMEVGTYKYLDYDEFASVMKDLGIETVPVLYRGPWSDECRKLAEGKTTIGGDHVREGIVIRPVVERKHERLGRVILKLVGEGYLLR